MRYDALIIGAGMSGLGAGIRLAQAGKRVLILERHYLWGGLNSFYKRGGRRFDTGLHALTNYVPRGTAGAPLTRILRQLRIPYDAWKLAPQRRSRTAMRVRGETLRLEYSNDFELMRSEIARLFPAEVGGFDALCRALPAYDLGNTAVFERSARAELARFFRDPLLIEMLLVAPMFYGSASEHDMSWGDFGVLFRSIHLEGMARPEDGIRGVLDTLLERFRAEGGELRLRCDVAAIVHDAGRVRGVRLASGEELEAERVFSSAGLLETRALLGGAALADGATAGRMSFLETCSVLSAAPAELGHDATIVFFCDGERLHYERPEAPVDARSGVITCPSNYLSSAPPEESVVRVTCPANHERWLGLDDGAYAAQKERAVEAMLDAASVFAFDPRPHTVFRDAFTPRTIERFTGHRGGAVYGSATKLRDGATGIEGLHVIGTDQGLVGVVGALLSGISIVNATMLRPVEGAR